MPSCSITLSLRYHTWHHALNCVGQIPGQHKLLLECLKGISKEENVKIYEVYLTYDLFSSIVDLCHYIYCLNIVTLYVILKITFIN